MSEHGQVGARPLIALHGFPEDRHCWDAMAVRVAPAGFRILAPDQRGYSPRASPSDRRAYGIAELGADVLALADAAGVQQFDLIGHDWGAVVGWWLAGRHPDRVRSLAALSVPHPRAFGESLRQGRQLLRSWYALAFQVPVIPEALMSLAGPDAAARAMERDGLDSESAARYAARMARPGALTGPLNWYRAAFPGGLATGSFPPVAVPTLYVWSEGDHYLDRVGAELCHRYVTGPYRFEILPGSHWLPSTSVDGLVPLVLRHLEGVDG